MRALRVLRWLGVATGGDLTRYRNAITMSFAVSVHVPTGAVAGSQKEERNVVYILAIRY
jgi:hypothetical protein